MSANFQVTIKKNKDNLHIIPKGDFDGSSACELINLLHEQYKGKGMVVIDTRQLKQMCPFGCTAFQCMLNRRIVPADCLIFNGEKGHQIAPRGSRIILKPTQRICKCKNPCAGCISDNKK